MTDDTSALGEWVQRRTTFQRVYDTVVGTTEYVPVETVAERAHSSTAARDALAQLVEVGVAKRRDGRSATYRRNESYLTWKQVERLATETSEETLRSRLAELTERGREFRERFDALAPDAVGAVGTPVDDHKTVEARWEAMSEWETVRRDVRVVRRAVDRARRGSKAPA
ncbi:hypothetical protein [Halobaculum sp. MBLA0143]|uniref:DUF7342 family protein n=1 Tax=Halobaculum sp. MBLA0143 TaxID=3079933 RepID=UPI003525305D